MYNLVHETSLIYLQFTILLFFISINDKYITFALYEEHFKQIFCEKLLLKLKTNRFYNLRNISRTRTFAKKRHLCHLLELIESRAYYTERPHNYLVVT